MTKRQRRYVLADILVIYQGIVIAPLSKYQISRKGSAKGEGSSKRIRARVIKARNLALVGQTKVNSALSPAEVKFICSLSEQGQQILEQAMDPFGLSHRAYHRILKLARTIADLANSEQIEIPDSSEAIAYRKLDRSK